MAITANTTRPVQFLRRFSGSMEPPLYEFPVGTASVVWRKGDGVYIPATPDGKVDKAAGAAGTGINLPQVDGEGLIGFFHGPSASAPPFPSSTGIQGTYTSPTITTDGAADERISVCLCLPDCLFMAHQTDGASDITDPIRNPSASATGGLLRRNGLWVGTPTGETERVMYDCSVTTNAIAFAWDWAYPQMQPARGTSYVGDPNAWKTTTDNPAIEFSVIISPLAGPTI